MKISEIKIQDEYITCDVKDKISDKLREIMKNKDKRINYIIVTELDKPVGIIGFRDIVLRLLNEKRKIGDILAEEIMASPVVTTKKDKNINEVFNLMSSMGFRSLPVVDDDEKLIGCISINDLMNAIGVDKNDKKV